VCLGRPTIEIFALSKASASINAFVTPKKYPSIDRVGYQTRT